MFNSASKTLVAVALGMASLASLAADEHKGHDAKSQFGGVVTVVKDVNFELVTAPDSMRLHVTDHGKPASLTGASAKVTLLAGTNKTDVSLSPAGDKLEGKGSFTYPPGTKVVAMVVLPGKGTVPVRFTLK